MERKHKLNGKRPAPMPQSVHSAQQTTTATRTANMGNAHMHDQAIECAHILSCLDCKSSC